MAENGRGHIEVQSRNIPRDRGKRTPVKRLDSQPVFEPDN
jgi:hypothetical protein